MKKATKQLTQQEAMTRSQIINDDSLTYSVTFLVLKEIYAAEFKATFSLKKVIDI